jgi:hypothetical protein
VAQFHIFFLGCLRVQMPVVAGTAHFRQPALLFDR